MMSEQDKIDKAYRKREEGMNIIRMFTSIIIGIGVLAGILALLKPATAATTQSTFSLPSKCLAIPVLLFGLFITRLLLLGIFGSFAERREHKRLVKERHERETPQPKPETRPGILVLHAPSVSRAEREKQAQKQIQTQREEYRQEQHEIRKRQKAAMQKRKQERADDARMKEISAMPDERARIDAYAKLRNEQIKRITE